MGEKVVEVPQIQTVERVVQAPAPVITEVIAPTYAAPTYAAAAPITTMAAPLTTVGAPLMGTTTMAAPFGTVGGYGAPVVETFAPTVGGYGTVGNTFGVAPTIL